MRFHRHVIGALATVVALGAAAAHAAPSALACTTKTLTGTYVFYADGWTAPSGAWVPKAVLEQMRFNGDGTIDVLAGTIANRAGDGQVIELPPGITGTYALSAGCTGKIQFGNAPNFDIVVAPGGHAGHFIQTDAWNVQQGTLQRIGR